MILSVFFSKSKPINFIIVGAYMVLFYGYAHFKAGITLEPFYIFSVVAGLIAYIFCMLGIDFVAKKNDLCKSNSYIIVIFAVATTILPVALVSPEIVIAGFAILLALRRILSLRSQRGTQKKILDASLWIMSASAFYFWSLLFFVLLFLGIGYYARQNYRNWLIPMVGVLVSYVLATSATLLLWDDYFSFNNYIDQFSLFFDSNTTPKEWVTLVLFLCITIFFLMYYLINYKGRKTKSKPAIVLIISMVLIAITIVLIDPKKNTAALFFLTVPVALMGTSYLQSSGNRIVKEGLLWFLIIAAVVLTFF